jgi:hypothetical protein
VESIIIHFLYLLEYFRCLICDSKACHYSGGRGEGGVVKHIVNTVFVKSFSVQRLVLLCPEILCNTSWFCDCWFQQHSATCHCATKTTHMHRDLLGDSLISKKFSQIWYPGLTTPQAARLLRSWVRVPPRAWLFVCCECRVLSGRGLCDELITRPGKSYRLWCVVVCDLETSIMGALYIYIYIYMILVACSIYIYDISSLRVNDLTLIFLTWRKWWAPNNTSKEQMGFNS